MSGWARWLAACAAAATALATWSQPGAPARPAELDGVVVWVTDGDSLGVERAAGGAPLTVRLQGIDAPEICQPWGPQAKAALEAMVLGRTVVVVPKGRDDHGRTLAQVRVDGTDVGERLVRDGHAWSHRYKHDRGPFVAQERMARALGRGLHADGAAETPRDFRRRHGPCVVDGPAQASAPAPAPVPAPATPGGSATTPSSTAAIAGRRCDGRRFCTQMTSCEEATWFLRHCPGMEMDGDRDGIPCEQQWCR